MNCQPGVSLQSRAALLEAEMHTCMYNVQMNLHQYLTHKKKLRRGGSAKNILFEVIAEIGKAKAVRFIWSIVVEMCLQIYLVEFGTRPFMSILCSVCPLCILYAFWLSGTCSFVVCHSFEDIWLVELKPCVTYSLPYVSTVLCPMHVRL